MTGLVLAAWAVSASLFTVDVGEYVAVTRFGRVLKVIDAPGLGLKFPFDQVVRVEKRLLHMRPARAEYLTTDKKSLMVRSLVIWRIADPERFLGTVVNRGRAESRLTDIVLAEIGSVLGRHEFSSLISVNGGGAARLRAAGSDIRDHSNTVTMPEFGIEVVDVRLRQLSLPDQNKRYVFERMQAERGRIAMQHRSEGERESKEIIAVARGEKTRLMAAAYKEAEQTKGAADAEVIEIYGSAFGRNPKFYKFLRTLQAYEKILDDKTTLFLPADAEIFRLLQNGRPAKSP